MILTQLLSLFLFVTLNLIAAYGSEPLKKYLAIRAAKTSSQSMQKTLYFECLNNLKVSPKNWFFLEREIDQDSLRAPSYCFVKEKVDFDWFYAIPLSDSATGDYDCHIRAGFWECQPSIPRPSQIFYCSSLPMSQSDTFIISEQSREIMAYCAFSAAEFMIPVGSGEAYLKAYNHPLYPIVREYTVPANQNFDLNFGLDRLVDTIPSCLSANFKDSIHFEQCAKEKCIGSVVQNLTLFNDIQEKIKVGVEYSSNLRMAFSIPIIPVDEDLSAFFIRQNNILLITSRALSLGHQYSVRVAGDLKIPCGFLKSKEFAEILKCELNHSNAFSLNSRLELEVQSKDLNLSYKLPIRKDAIIKSALTPDGKSFKKLLPFKYHNLSSGSYLEIFGVPKSLGQWLSKENGIIDCDFFTGHSTVGKLLSAKRILCPIASNTDDLGSLSPLHVGIQIVENQINVAIYTDQKTPTYPTYFRLLSSSSDSFYALSPLDPIIIMDPAESSEVKFSILKPINLLLLDNNDYL